MEFGKNNDRASSGKAKPPGAEDFKPGAVYRAVLVDTIQHPLTILPAAVAAVSVLYLGLVDLDPAALGVAFVSALVALGTWVWNYVIRGEELARRHVERLREKRQAFRLEEASSLVADWEAAGHAYGTQQARELSAAYRRLDELLKGHLSRAGNRASMTFQRLGVLAEDTYREGVTILRRALGIHRALGQVERDKLEHELTAWQAELAGCRDAADPDATDPDVEAHERSLATRIAAHERRLELYGEQTRLFEELFAQSETLEAALESTYLEALQLDSAETLFAQGRAASELEAAVGAARRVDERLRNIGPAPSEDDEIYLNAGHRPE